jgi:hypothetical protein
MCLKQKNSLKVCGRYHIRLAKTHCGGSGVWFRSMPGDSSEEEQAVYEVLARHVLTADALSTLSGNGQNSRSRKPTTPGEMARSAGAASLQLPPLRCVYSLEKTFVSTTTGNGQNSKCRKPTTPGEMARSAGAASLQLPFSSSAIRNCRLTASGYRTRKP